MYFSLYHLNELYDVVHNLLGSIFFFFIFLYEMGRDNLTCWFTPQCLQYLGQGQIKVSCWELNLGIPCKWQFLDSIINCLPAYVNRKLESWAHKKGQDNPGSVLIRDVGSNDSFSASTYSTLLNLFIANEIHFLFISLDDIYNKFPKMLIWKFSLFMYLFTEFLFYFCFFFLAVKQPHHHDSQFCVSLNALKVSSRAFTMCFL